LLVSWLSDLVLKKIIIAFFLLNDKCHLPVGHCATPHILWIYSKGKRAELPTNHVFPAFWWKKSPNWQWIMAEQI